MPKRSKRHSMQREKILDCARTLFWVKGYDKTTMSDIAKARGFEPSNIYNYYKSKEHLLYEVLKFGLKQQLSLMKDLETDNVRDPVERLTLMIKRNIDYVLGHRRSSGVLFDVGLRDLSPKHRKEIIELRDRYDRILRKIIRDGIDSGNFAATNEKVAAFAITSIIARTLIWFSPKGELSQDDIADLTIEFALGGLRPKKYNNRSKLLQKPNSA